MWCTVSYISTYTNLSFLSSILLACHLRKNLPLLTNAFKLATTLVISKFRLGLLKSSHIEIVNSLNQIIRQKIYCDLCYLCFWKTNYYFTPLPLECQELVWLPRLLLTMRYSRLGPHHSQSRFENISLSWWIWHCIASNLWRVFALKVAIYDTDYIQG